MKKQAIGIFDSGIGGTSIWKEIAIALPNEDTIYLADSKFAPYGKRSKEEIISLSIKNTKKLLELNCKIIVVACNTATTNAIKTLRNQFDVPFIGIEPAIKPAALKTKTKKIGILATKGTLSSELFATTSDLYTNNTEVIEVIGTGLVELIEAGKIYSEEMLTLLSSYIQPLVEKDIDYLVLGCSHYPYLIPVLKKILPKNIIIIDSGEAVARQTKVILSNNDLLNENASEGSHIFFTNGRLSVLQNILKKSNISTDTNQLEF
ncbi:glutamate racemase [Aquimarina sp. MMG015]|uniref:glutamate racemase n=1 Tax=Aquimarina TaxID=290174 RepID=UPI00041A6D31|nr:MULTISPECIES: glutamate racemase [Aquimarina]AXT57852.1 glutamate racemase [Aquimarina sp. AD1]MBQ4803205.1 glutamate racemase [Aquimarina sp. MMG015]RKN34989.1 glutamate racemase [Aquimarina sp. AD1]